MQLECLHVSALDPLRLRGALHHLRALIGWSLHQVQPMTTTDGKHQPGRDQLTRDARQVLELCYALRPC